MKLNVGQILIPLGAIVCLFPQISSAMALLLGVIIAVIFGNPFLESSRKFTPKLLQLSVVGLGAGMNLNVVGKVGLQGIGYTAVGIVSALILGTLFGRFLKTSRNESILISVGTAICGGSAIAAVSPVIRAKSHETSVALGVVFLLNSVALILFPFIGHYFQLSQTQFGLWSALAIHDTSSVVGATLQYGAKAVEIGTTVKLARSLWIVPVTFLFGMIARKDKSELKIKAKKPWFILGFLLAAAIVTWIPSLQHAGSIVNEVAKRMLVVTLYLIGSSLTRETIRQVGFKPFAQGLLLWIFVAVGSLGFILETSI